MSPDIVIRAQGLGKRYVIGHQSARERVPTLRDAIVRAAGGFVRTAGDMLRGRAILTGEEREEFWALQDVSFEVPRGEVLGVIGRNGAGKSTLLKVLSQITEPSAGRVEIKGRVASLLEVGTGFHPELTGRENIFLNGAILGMTRAEIRRRFDEIVAFAEVEKFLDTPVKRYSSGMYVRLAFAVAAHLEPEILVVDEVLAVGDIEFQKKCLGKMQDVAGSGRTVLFVSHNTGTIQTLCTKCLLFDRGALVMHCPTSEAVREYSRRSLESSVFVPDARLDKDAHISSCEVSVNQGSVSLAVEIQSRLSIRVTLAAFLKDAAGTPVGVAALGGFGSPRIPLSVGRNTFDLEIDTSRLASGNYTITLEVTDPGRRLDLQEDMFKVSINPSPLPGHSEALEQSWGYGAYHLPLSGRRVEAGVQDAESAETPFDSVPLVDGASPS